MTPAEHRQQAEQILVEAHATHESQVVPGVQVRNYGYDALLVMYAEAQVHALLAERFPLTAADLELIGDALSELHRYKGRTAEVEDLCRRTGLKITVD